MERRKNCSHRWVTNAKVLYITWQTEDKWLWKISLCVTVKLWHGAPADIKPPSLSAHRRLCTENPYYIFFVAHQPHSGLGRGYEITIRHTRLGRTVLEEESARRRVNTQHSQETDFHSPSGIRSCNRSKRLVADLRHRRRGHLDRPSII